MTAEEIREKIIEELNSDLEADFIDEKTKNEYLEDFDNWIKKAKFGDEYCYAGEEYYYTENFDEYDTENMGKILDMIYSGDKKEDEYVTVISGYSNDDGLMNYFYDLPYDFSYDSDFSVYLSIEISENKKEAYWNLFNYKAEPFDHISRDEEMDKKIKDIITHTVIKELKRMGYDIETVEYNQGIELRNTIPDERELYG